MNFMAANIHQMMSKMTPASDEHDAFESGGMSLALIRRDRLKEWMSPRKITQADLARYLQVRTSYVASLLAPVPTRNIGEKTARKIEEALKMPHLYLDGEEQGSKPSRSAAIPIGDAFAVPQLVRRKGLNVQDPASPLTLSTSILELAETPPEKAAWLPVRSSEMSPSLPNGSIALIDTSSIAPIDGKVYVLVIKDQFVFRRVHVTPLGYTLTADASHTPTLTFTENEFESHIGVAGRIRMALNALN